MKTFAFVTILLFQLSAIAEECGDPDMKHWQTNLSFKAAQVTLYWTGVYEGNDSVCNLTYTTNSAKATTLEVFGQPVINQSQSLIAFVSCADDGCENKISVANIAQGVILKTELPLDPNSQFYLKANWQGSTNELSIVTDPPIQKHFICSVTDTIRCNSNGI